MDPMMSKMLCVSEKYGVVEEVLSITAMLNIGGALFYKPKDKVEKQAGRFSVCLSICYLIASPSFWLFCLALGSKSFSHDCI